MFQVISDTLRLVSISRTDPNLRSVVLSGSSLYKNWDSAFPYDWIKHRIELSKKLSNNYNDPGTREGYGLNACKRFIPCLINQYYVNHGT